MKLEPMYEVKYDDNAIDFALRVADEDLTIAISQNELGTNASQILALKSNFKKDKVFAFIVKNDEKDRYIYELTDEIIDSFFSNETDDVLESFNIRVFVLHDLNELDMDDLKKV